MLVELLQAKIREASIKLLYSEAEAFNSAWVARGDFNKALKAYETPPGYLVQRTSESSFRVVHVDSGYYVGFAQNKSVAPELPLLEIGKLVAVESVSNGQRHSRTWVG